MIERYHSDGIGVNEREVLRYLGYGTAPMDEGTKVLYDECLEILNRTLRCRASRCILPARIGVAETKIAENTFKSASLAAHLAGAEQVILMCATIGPLFDRESEKLMHASPARALIYGAMGTAAVEEWCDRLCGEWEEEFAREGMHLTGRFSPGYGDLSLSCQPDLLQLTDAGRSAGITLTEGGMMIPKKSVSAIIGIKKESSKGRELTGCSACGKKDCDYCEFSKA